MADDQEHDGASVQEQLVEACRRNNTELLQEIIDNCKSEEEISNLMNNTKSVLGNHLYHEAALQGNCTFFRRLVTATFTPHPHVTYSQPSSYRDRFRLIFYDATTT